MNRARPDIGKKGPYGKTMRPIGSEYMGKDGYIMVKVALCPTVPGSKDNWKLKHKVVWEQAHNTEVPKGYVVMFKDRNTRNFDPENLEAVPRGTMQRMNRLVYENPKLKWYDAKSFEVVRLMAEIDRARTKRKAISSKPF